MAKSNDEDVRLPREENPHQGVGFKFGKLKERDEAQKRELERERLIEEKNAEESRRDNEVG